MDNAEMSQGANLYQYLGNDPVDKIDPIGLFKYYGNWGGPNWTGGFKQPWNQLTPSQQQDALNNPNRAPIDAQDECYKEHDICYGGCKCFWCRSGCDGKLSKRLGDLGKNHSPASNWHSRIGEGVFALRLGAVSSLFN
jgi:hypothetical protein